MKQENIEKKKLLDRSLVITSVLCLLPMLFAAVVYQDLPEQVAVHWNSAGEPNGYAHKALAAFGLPCFMLAINLICHVAMNSDPKRRGQSKAAVTLGKWCAPVLSLILVPMTLLIALGTNLSIELVVPYLVGLLLIVVGNYLPKCRQNYTVGIKLPWTLHDEDNWDKTHRMAGPLWMAGGAVFILGALLNWSWLIISVVAAIILVPMIYSFVLYWRKKT